ncbi:MAG: alkaline phosphatase D family protein [Bacteroidia bacterium]|nr:alkaline phosphatase D family protein [Bacteroidia bacterium]
MKQVFTSLFCLLGIQVVLAQTITHGPVVGGVTHNSARIWLRTSEPAAFTILLEEESGGSVKEISKSTQANQDNSTIVDINNLAANKNYNYRIRISDKLSEKYSFRTFPTPGTPSNFSFAFGSCHGYSTSPIPEPVFTTLLGHKPLLVLDLGDWGYPDITDNYPQDSNFFALDYNKIIESYRVRYSGAEIKKLMEGTPLSYVYDDHDYMNNNSSEYSCSYILNNSFLEVGFPRYARRNIIDAYTKFFPHYPLPDTSRGVYHKITCGNVDIFFIDNRASRSPNHNALKRRGNKYTYAPPIGHSMLGATQKQWLLEELKNSKAHWKFIAGGVAFNKGYRRLIKEFTENDALLQQLRLLPPQLLQQIPGGGIEGLLSATVDTWAGFAQEQDEILDFIKKNNIKNVIFLSGDSHTSAIDDGTNAGIPELMSGNFSQNNSRLASFMANAKNLPFVGSLIKEDLNIWNAGGQGLGNQNFEAAFGKVEIFGNDSCRLSIVDVNNTVVAKLTLCKDGKPCNTTSRSRNLTLLTYALELYPNPAENTITLLNRQNQKLPEEAQLLILDINGKLQNSTSAKELVQSGKQEINIQNLAKGAYTLIFAAKGVWQSFLFQKN